MEEREGQRASRADSSASICCAESFRRRAKSSSLNPPEFCGLKSITWSQYIIFKKVEVVDASTTDPFLLCFWLSRRPSGLLLPKPLASRRGAVIRMAFVLHLREMPEKQKL